MGPNSSDANTLIRFHWIAMNKRRQPHTGFTLLEMVVVILVLGILAGVAAPKFTSLSKDSQAATILQNVNVIFDAVEMFAAEHGRLPDDADAGEIPTELEPYLRSTKIFTESTSYCSTFEWDGPNGPTTSFGVALTVTGGATGMQLYMKLEEIADDGTAVAGWIRAGGGGSVKFMLNP